MHPRNPKITDANVFDYKDCYPVVQELKVFHIIHYICEFFSVACTTFLVILNFLVGFDIFFVLYTLITALLVTLGICYVCYPMNNFSRHILVKVAICILGKLCIAAVIYYTFVVIFNISWEDCIYEEECQYNWFFILLGLINLSPTLYFFSVIAIIAKRMSIANKIRQHINQDHLPTKHGSCSSTPTFSSPPRP
ncbi:unnamed protein product [Moneuplotes crassus]|uniref:Uncharacterized protein n=1 Tax=Euplotes crassus TaxID=5936 RepID=A0AAD1XVW4_EUPCR|nr:unnamed protein product [Moneuplotes crassus]